MPLIKYDIFDNDIQIAIWKIDETENFLKELSKLNSEECSHCENFKLEIRRKQFYIARILANKVSKEQSKIVYNENGKPSLESKKINISITHNSEYVALIASKKHEVGIDIESITERVHKIKHKFMNTEDLEKINKKNETLELYLNWCAKEAIYKIFDYNKLYFKDIRTKNIDFTETYFNAYTRVFDIDYNFKMNYRIFDNNILVWTKKTQ